MNYQSLDQSPGDDEMPDRKTMDKITVTKLENEADEEPPSPHRSRSYVYVDNALSGYSTTKYIKINKE